MRELLQKLTPEEERAFLRNLWHHLSNIGDPAWIMDLGEELGA